MTTSTDAFNVQSAFDNRAGARHLARKRSARTTAAAHAAPRRRLIFGQLLVFSPLQEEMLRENRERAWLELHSVVAGRF